MCHVPSRLLPMLSAALLSLSLTASAQETKLQIAGSEIDVVFGSPVSDSLRQMVLDRVKLSAKAIVNYYRRYPVSEVRIDVSPHFGKGVSGGHASGWDGARI
ncbi:MAG TPA: hypothetical protein VHS80_02610, partial [Chthoniobacterales bacterium]|nr:hypothetical protein [Chthoniobacterales bacterium]